MASLVASVPLPLPLDSLLASSWTWLALSLATIATLLRALSRISFSHHRCQALLPPPSSIFSAERAHVSSDISDLSTPLQKSQKRRPGCKSTPTLQALVQSHGHTGVAYPEVRFLSCVGNLLVSTSKIQSFCERTDGLKYARTSSCTPGLWSRLGVLVDSEERVSRSSAQGFIGDSHETACMPSKKPLLDTPPPLSNVPPCFETQFGWRDLLETKFGLQWQVQTGALPFEPVHVVKLWSVHERNLFKALNVEVNSVEALNVDIAGGLACISETNGDISHWDIINQACLTRVFSDVDSVSALCWKAESRFTIAGNCNGLALWDFRSPNLIPIWNGIASSGAYGSLHCEGNTICIYWCSGIRQFCDLRKSQVDCFSNTRVVLPFGVPSGMEAEWSFALWEKLSCDDEEAWDELEWNDDASFKSSSFTSRCVTLVRSLSSSGR